MTLLPGSRSQTSVTSPRSTRPPQSTKSPKTITVVKEVVNKTKTPDAHGVTDQPDTRKTNLTAQQRTVRVLDAVGHSGRFAKEQVTSALPVS